MELAPKMIQELEGFDIVHFDRQGKIEHELWTWLATRNGASPMGRRTCMGRYGGSLHAAMNNLGFWTVHLWERTFLAMEGDMLTGTKFMTKLKAKLPAAESSDAASSTDPRPIQVEDRALKSCCGNSVVVSVMALQAPEHQWSVCMLHWRPLRMPSTLDRLAS